MRGSIYSLKIISYIVGQIETDNHQPNVTDVRPKVNAGNSGAEQRQRQKKDMTERTRR